MKLQKTLEQDQQYKKLHQIKLDFELFSNDQEDQLK